jgi:undecaprenyl-diphosphatase
MLERLDTFDKNLFLWLNGHNSPFFDRVMWFVSGKIEWLPLYLLIIGYIIYKYHWKSITILIAVIIAVALADQIAVIAFKNVFHRLRPSQNQEIQNLVHIVKGYRGGLYGFVSNHAANTFSFSVFLSMLLRKTWLSISILFWASVVSYSRIYLGVHYPGDVIGGALLGIIIGLSVFILYLKVESKIYNHPPDVEKVK